MPHIRHHLAPGFGDLLPGWFVLPQNPLRDAQTPAGALVPSLTGLSRGRPVRIRRVGELMAGQFVVPQNPVRAALSGGVGCGCAGGCSGLGTSTNYVLKRYSYGSEGAFAFVPEQVNYGLAGRRLGPVGFAGLGARHTMLPVGFSGLGQTSVGDWLNESTITDSLAIPNWASLATAGVLLLWAYTAVRGHKK